MMRFGHRPQQLQFRCSDADAFVRLALGKRKAAFFRIMKGICFVEMPLAALGRDADDTFFLRLKTT